MKAITEESLATIEFRLHWNSDDADHEERFYKTVNISRDILPRGVAHRLLGKYPGEEIEARYPADETPFPFDPKNKVAIRRNQFCSDKHSLSHGRFYPLGTLKDLPNVFPGNVKPFRLIDVDDRSLTADLNHPLSGHDLYLTAIVHDSIIKPYDRGGEYSVLMETITDGPGMQVRVNGRPTGFFTDDSFRREDETGDALFYQHPRLVNHIDSRAIDTITTLYGSFIKPGMDVLDLMSAWRSHVPETSGLKSLVGLGMNAEEMAANPQLTDYIVHDLNVKPQLPFPDNSFDLVICTVSLEYLVHPADVFNGVAGVLRPGGAFIVTFSNRWFPPKVIRVWPSLHEFERMGLALEYFMQSNRFKDLNTFSSRGWPRPMEDKYYPQYVISDPVYAVWGRAKQNE